MTIRSIDKSQLPLDRPLYAEDAPDPALRYLRYPARDGFVLGALLYTPETPTDRVFILVPGLSGGILGGPHDYRPLARRVVDGGAAVFLLNMRSANTFAQARFPDSASDIAGAVDWLKAHGYSRIALFGTSLGGPRVAYYNEIHGDPAVEMIGFLASIRSPYLAVSDGPGAAHMAELDAVLSEARALVAAGKPQAGLTFDHLLPGRPQTMGAASFLSYFGTPDDTPCNTIHHGAAITVPTLVVHGTKDEISNISNGRDIYDSLTAAPSRELLYVEGADHYLTAGWICRAYAEIVASWTEARFAGLPVAG
ncbi:MAG: hypothetical protein KDK12_00315 [Rhodobacteraceae bacterium]|nr:hypothetical protein [Paracoccaceae bacterium]